MAKRRRDAGREAFWREVLRRQAVSGLGVRAFCRQEKLAESAFHWWRREIARRDAPKRPTGRPSTRPAKPPAFLPVVREHQQQREEAITIELAGRRVLRLPGSMPVGRLAEVVQALETGWAAGASGGGER
jgi:hypothetical protein